MLLHNPESRLTSPLTECVGSRCDPSFQIRPERRLITHIARMLRVSIKPGYRKSRTPSLKEMAVIRNAMLSCFGDCADNGAMRLRAKITNAKTPGELWMLRNDTYQVISHHHNQSVAAERINGLLRAFEGWVDPKQITRIK